MVEIPMPTFEDEKMQDAAFEMKKVFFSHFPIPPAANDKEIDNIMRAMIFIYMGTMLELIARFKPPSIGLVDAFMQLANQFVDANAEELGKILNERGAQ